MTRVFLHGGGDHPENRALTFGRFTQEALADGPGPIALVAVDADAEECAATVAAYQAIFVSIGVSEHIIAPLAISPDQPLTYTMLADVQPRALFVCGGVTPLYHQALCVDQHWLAYLRETRMLYCGTSAGAAIAATTAILGGWRVQRGDIPRAALFQGAGEGLDLLTVAPGLGLISGAVDAHASQWGTLLRLIHTSDLGMTPGGWALDEDTMLIIDGNDAELVGRGHLYHVTSGAEHGVAITIHSAPATIAI